MDQQPQHDPCKKQQPQCPSKQKILFRSPLDPNTEYQLSIRSPLDPEAQYRLVWAKQSLWERRLGHLQERYPLKTVGEKDDYEDDQTWMLDGSQDTVDRWGESSSVVSTVDRWGESNPATPGDDDDDDDKSVGSCRWNDEASVGSTDKTPSPPSRPSSPVMSEDSLRDDSSEQNAYPVSWLEGFYDTVREIRTARQA